MTPAREQPAAVVLVSGGLDSATTLAIARNDGFDCVALTFDYGQRHRVELDAARRVANSLGASGHVIVPIDLRAFGGSALTADDIEVPRHDAGVEAIEPGEIPVTYVPARNTVFLSFALACAESRGSRDVFIGANAIDYSGYPDCRPAFIEAFERLANVATKIGVEAAAGRGRPFRIHAPIIEKSKADVIRIGHDLGVDYALTHSCYDPDGATGAACGACDSCVIRRRGFLEAGVADPTTYQR